MGNRLKLYDDVIYTYLDHKNKIKFRNIAFKNKMTVSEFNRYLIQLAIMLDDSNKLNSKLQFKEQDIVTLLSKIGRDI